MTKRASASRTRATFRRMQDGTAEDYALVDAAEREYEQGLVDRVLDALRALDGGVQGYAVSRYTHSLQSATRALREERSAEYVVAALLHDIGDVLAPHAHGAFAAAVLRPYVSERTAWMVSQHPVFQTHYYAPHLGARGDERERFRDHPWFDDVVQFCERYDENCFDPDYDTLPEEVFAPLVRHVFAREPFTAG